MKDVMCGLRKTVKWLLTVFASLFVFMLVLWVVLPDEDLTGEVVQILKDPPRVPAKQNAFYVFWGFEADPSLDAHSVGMSMVEALEQARAQQKSIAYDDLQWFLGTSPLKIDRSDKDLYQAGTNSLTQVRAERAKIEVSEQKLQPYIKRYQLLRSYTDFKEPVPRNADEPMLGYAGLVAISGLTDARITLDMADKAKQGAALKNLAAELRLWRRVSQESETLITKMVATKVLQRKFGLVADLLAESPEIAVNPPDLLAEITRPLAENEISLERALLGEFRWVSGMFLGLLSEIDAAPYSVSNMFNKLILARGFKPKATVNLSFAKNKELRDFYNRPAAAIAVNKSAFIADWGRFSSYSPSTLFYNPVGKVLVYVAPPDYGTYVYRMHDLDALSRLLELQRQLAVARLSTDKVAAFLRQSDASLRDPYTGKPMRWDPVARTLSMQGHGKDGDKLSVRLSF